MNAQMLLQSFAGGDDEKTYVDDVFSTYLYTGNGSTQTINNGIDLAGEGGLVWIKSRINNYGGNSYDRHTLFDSERDSGDALYTNGDDKLDGAVGQSIFNAEGFDVTSGRSISGVSYASWTFRKAPKFFDIVTYTGNGVAGRQISHELGVEPGFITTKSTSKTGNWNSYHRSATGDLVLNTTAAQTDPRAIITAADSSTFTVSGVANTNGVQYVAYLWAHDDSEDGIIQCGSFTTDASGNATVTTGWEPQFIKIKASSATSDWMMLDSLRGMPVGGTDARLYANTSGSEAFASTADPTASGFNATSLSAKTTYIFTAIRKGPMRG